MPSLPVPVPPIPAAAAADFAAEPAAPTAPLRVLLLGWEYAPRLVGGLGTASVRLAHELARHADLSVIVPRLPEAAPEETAPPLSFDELARGDEDLPDALRHFPPSSETHVAPPPAIPIAAAPDAEPLPVPPVPTQAQVEVLRQGGGMVSTTPTTLTTSTTPTLRLRILSHLTAADVRAATAAPAPPRYEVFARRVQQVTLGFSPYAEAPEPQRTAIATDGPSPAAPETSIGTYGLSPLESPTSIDGDGPLPARPHPPTPSPKREAEPDGIGFGSPSPSERGPGGEDKREAEPDVSRFGSPSPSERGPRGEDKREGEPDGLGFGSPSPSDRELGGEDAQEPEREDPLAQALAPFQLPVPPAPAGGLSPLFALPSSNTEVVQFGRLAARLASGEAVDVVYAHDWPTFLAGIEIRLEKRVPLVLHVHSTSFDRQGPGPRAWVFELERAAFRAADAIVAVSRHGARVLTDAYGVDPARIRVVYHGVTPGPLGLGWDLPPAAPDAAPLVLFVGRLTDQKNPLGFVEIARRVRAELPAARFALAGDGPLRDAVARAAQAAGLPDEQFTLLGFLDDDAVQAALREAAVVCLPARSEPFGLAALEAAAAGVPLVLSRTTGAAEVLPGALTAAWDDAAALAAHVLTLLRDAPLRRRATRENAAAARRLTWERAAAEVLAVLEGVRA